MDMVGCCPTGLRGKTREISLLWLGAHSVSHSCCPIESGQLEDGEAVPEHATHEGEQSGETVGPSALKSYVSEQYIQQQSGPELPSDGVLGVAEEVADFEGLLDLLEESLNTPAAAVEIADACGCPLKVIGKKNHDHPLFIDFDPCFDPAKTLGILLARFGRKQNDLVVAQDVALGLFQALANHPVVQVVLGASYPENAPACQVEKVGEVHVGLVEDGDLTGLQPGAQRQSPCVVLMGSLLDNGEGGKEALEVEPQVHLGGRFATPVPGPVHTVGHQGNGGGVHCVNGSLEAVWQTPVAARRAKAGSKLLEMLEHFPEKLLHHVAVAVPVGVRKGVSARRYRSPNGSEFGRMMPQGVTDIVESDGMGQLREKQTHDMAPRRKSTSPFIDPILTGQFFGQMRRDKFTKLMQCAGVVLGRRNCFHTSDSLVGIRRRPPFFNPEKTTLQLHPMG